MTSDMKILKRKQIRLSGIMLPKFQEVWLEWKKSEYSRYVLKGGEVEQNLLI